MKTSRMFVRYKLPRALHLQSHVAVKATSLLTHRSPGKLAVLVTQAGCTQRTLLALSAGGAQVAQLEVYAVAPQHDGLPLVRRRR